MQQDSVMDVARLVNRCARSFSRVGDGRMRRTGFGFNQFPVLASLRSGHAWTQAELARQIGIEQPSMAQMLARMERDGQIQRTPDPNDRRSQLISLTPNTLSRLQDVAEIMLGINAEALAGFTEREIDTFLVLLQRLNQNLDEAVRNAPSP